MNGWILLAVVLATVLELSGCDFTAAEEAFNDFDVIISLEEVNTFVALAVVDGQTQNFLQQDVNVRFQGDGGVYVIDMFSDPVSEMTISGGLGSFGISNGLTPNESTPLSVRVNVSAVGYQPNSSTISIRSSGRTDAQIHLVREASGLSGAETGVNAGLTNGAGLVVQSFRTTTSSNPINQAEAAVTVAAGTQGTTSSGEPASGMLQASIVYYTANSSSTAVAFPGGFQASVQAPDGGVAYAALTTAGFVSVTITDQTGHEITRFDPPLELSMEIEPGTLNPKTGSPIQTGDEITFFSYDEQGGFWSEEGPVQLTGPGSDGNFLATFFTGHLSTWSAGYTDPGCSSGVFSIQRNGNDGPISATASSVSGGWFGQTQIIPSGDSEFIVHDAPGFLTDFEITFELAGQQRIVQQDNSICGASANTSFAPSVNVTDVTFSLDLGTSCRALRVNDVPAFAVFYKLPTQSDAQAISISAQPIFELDELGRITGGRLTVPGLEIGQTYRFYTTVNNTRAERDILISGDQISFDLSEDVMAADMCVGG